MGFLDKFNDWYVHAIPDQAPGIDWREPAAGATYRWRKNFPALCLFMAALLPLVAAEIHFGKHSPGPSWPVSFGITGGFFALVVAAGWLIAPDPSPVFLSAKYVTFGSGRRRKTISLHRIDSVLRIESSDNIALSFCRGGKEVTRIFLNPANAAEVLAFVKNAGFAPA